MACREVKANQQTHDNRNRLASRSILERSRFDHVMPSACLTARPTRRPFALRLAPPTPRPLALRCPRPRFVLPAPATQIVTRSTLIPLQLVCLAYQSHSKTNGRYSSIAPHRVGRHQKRKTPLPQHPSLAAPCPSPIAVWTRRDLEGYRRIWTYSGPLLCVFSYRIGLNVPLSIL